MTLEQRDAAVGVLKKEYAHFAVQCEKYDAGELAKSVAAVTRTGMLSSSHLLSPSQQICHLHPLLARMAIYTYVLCTNIRVQWHVSNETLVQSEMELWYSLKWNVGTG